MAESLALREMMVVVEEEVVGIGHVCAIAWSVNGFVQIDLDLDPRFPFTKAVLDLREVGSSVI